MHYLTLIGMLKGENVFTYPPYDAELAQNCSIICGILRHTLSSTAAAISPTTSCPLYALMEADSVLRLINCDLKSISYLSSQLPLLKDNKWDADKQYKVASNIKTNQASEHIEQVLGNVAFKIPHSDELENRLLPGICSGTWCSRTAGASQGD